jgi:small subunit ribosomal protein S4e
MSKKGGSKHFIRMRAHKRLGVVERKAVRWLLAPNPGPHKKSDSISVGVLVRDVLHRARNIHEVKKILNSGNLLVDGKKITDTRYSIGLMDILSEPAEKKTYRVALLGPNMVPKEINADAASKKYLKVVGKHTIKGGKVCLSFHDGRNYIGDKHVSTGDTCLLSVPGFKMVSHIKLAPGARCLIVDGKHRGDIATLSKIIARPGSHASEALMTGASGDFVTVAKYLFAVDENFA